MNLKQKTWPSGLLDFRRLSGLVGRFICACACLGGFQSPAAHFQQIATIDQTREQILDHTRGGWTGMLIGGIVGLDHEFKYIDEPRQELPDYASLPERALAVKNCLSAVRRCETPVAVSNGFTQARLSGLLQNQVHSSVRCHSPLF
jgi:hypothetical protein